MRKYVKKVENELFLKLAIKTEPGSSLYNYSGCFSNLQGLL